MSAFSADEDLSLLLLAVLFEGENGAVNWTKVIKYLSPTTKTIQDLQLRAYHLKTTNATLVHTLPKTFLAGSRMFRDLNRPQAQIYQALDGIFGHLTKADVRQPSGRNHLNVGEIAAVGVSAILDVIDLTQTDIFLDIGSGTGNVLAQVALQAPVRRAIGLEIRSDLAMKSRDAIQAFTDEYPRLHLVKIITADVKVLTTQVRAEVENATVVFCNNVLFQPEDNLKIHQLICESSSPRTVVLTQRFCVRCTTMCPDLFCYLWKEVRVVKAKTCWKEELQEVYVFKRKRVLDTSSLLDVIDDL